MPGALLYLLLAASVGGTTCTRVSAYSWLLTHCWSCFLIVCLPNNTAFPCVCCRLWFMSSFSLFPVIFTWLGYWCCDSLNNLNNTVIRGICWIGRFYAGKYFAFVASFLFFVFFLIAINSYLVGVSHTAGSMTLNTPLTDFSFHQNWQGYSDAWKFTQNF